MRKPLHLADSLGLPLYWVNLVLLTKLPWKINWLGTNDIVAIFESRGIAYANWNYKAGAFGIVDMELKPDVPMIESLVGKDIDPTINY